MSLDPIPQENSKTQCMSLPAFAFFRAHEITRYIAVSFSEPCSECGFFILLISSRSLPNNWMTLFKENPKIYPKDEFYILKLAKDIYLSGDSASLFLLTLCGLSLGNFLRIYLKDFKMLTFQICFDMSKTIHKELWLELQKLHDCMVWTPTEYHSCMFSIVIVSKGFIGPLFINILWLKISSSKNVLSP